MTRFLDTFRSLLALSGVAIALRGHAAQDPSHWPEFRGPLGNGHSIATQLPVHWSATSNVVWTTDIPGTGWSSPVIDKHRVYLTTAAPVEGSQDLSLRALCLDEKSGSVLWNIELFRESAAQLARIHSKNSHASPTPILRDGRVYVHFGHQGTACLDTDGKVLWRNGELRYPPVHGNGGSPVLAGGLLIYSADGGSDPVVIALDAATGKLRWKTPRTTSPKKTFSFSTPQLIEVNNRTELISPGSGGLFSYDPQTGRELWKVRYGEGYSVVPRPVYSHGMLFVSSGYDRAVLYAVRPGGASGDATDTHVAWTATKGAPHTPSMLVVGDELYYVSDSGVATCADPVTGQVHWNERLGGDFSASPVYADGRIYFQNETGTGFVVKPGRQFELLAKNDLGERSLASYGVIQGSLLIRTQGHLRRIADKRP